MRLLETVRGLDQVGMVGGKRNRQTFGQADQGLVAGAAGAAPISHHFFFSTEKVAVDTEEVAAHLFFFDAKCREFCP